MSEIETAPEGAHPPLPVVHDEAGDTPIWLPASGLGFFVLMALFVLWRASHPAEVPVDAGDGAAEAAAVVVEAPAE